MGQLAEIVFESVEPARLVSLIAEFIGQAWLNEAEESEIEVAMNNDI